MKIFMIEFLVLLICMFCKCNGDDANESVLVLTIAVEETDGLLRYLKSADYYEIHPKVLGLDQKEKLAPGFEINLLKDALKDHVYDKEKIVLYTDNEDMLVLGPIQDIVDEFLKSNSKVLVGASYYSGLNEEFESKYPSLAVAGARFLSSAMFIGYAANIYNILEFNADETDKQLLFTKAYLDENFRNTNEIKLDHSFRVFQSLNGSIDDVRLNFNENGQFDLMNQKYFTNPLILNGNGPSKKVLNQYGNYLAGTYAYNECRIGHDQPISEHDASQHTIFLGLFIEKPTPFLEEFFEKIKALDYPKNKMYMFIHNVVEYHSDVVEKYYYELLNEDHITVQVIDAKHGIEETNAREMAVRQCGEVSCDYFFSVDSDAHIDAPETLKLLIMMNKTVIAPVLIKFNSNYANFWGITDDDGYYSRSSDYLKILDGEFKNIWNVPYITSAYLIKASVLPKVSYFKLDVDPDMALCQTFWEENIFMHVTNFHYYGHLIASDDFDTTRTRADLYEIFSNKPDWEKKYIHPDYWQNLKPDFKAAEPCPDVFWFPIVTDVFADSLVDVMEAFGKWSSGTNEDERLVTGYEAVPTRDIHLNQVGLEPMWLLFLQEYVRPLQLKVFTGYNEDPPKAIMNFVVRYRPDEQPSLRPHNDASTYSITLALNHANVDFQGGGCKFLRYNCAVTETKKGWLLMFPGRFTHFHEGLEVTNGTRYIMVSFVDP